MKTTKNQTGSADETEEAFVRHASTRASGPGSGEQEHASRQKTGQGTRHEPSFHKEKSSGQETATTNYYYYDSSCYYHYDSTTATTICGQQPRANAWGRPRVLLFHAS